MIVYFFFLRRVRNVVVLLTAEAIINGQNAVLGDWMPVRKMTVKPIRSAKLTL